MAQPYVGEIRIFAGNFAPVGIPRWARAIAAARSSSVVRNS